MPKSSGPKVVWCDIDGVILSANPPSDLPYMKRMQFLIDEANKFRSKMGWEPLGKFHLGQEDFLWHHMTDLSWVVSFLHEHPSDFIIDPRNFKEPTLLEKIGIAREIISRSVGFYFNQLEATPDLKYKPNYGIVRFMKKLRQEFQPRFITISGNPKDVAYDKEKRAGVLDFFLKDGKYPEGKFYGEDVLRREDAIYNAESVAGFAQNQLLLVDRESDLQQADPLGRIRIVFFGENPLEKPWYKYMAAHDTPLAKSFIESLIRDNRIIFFPGGFKKPGDIDKAMEFVRSRPSGKESTHSPLRQRL